MTRPQVDRERLEEECAADADVLASLKENGDVSSIARPLDVSFLGTREALDRLAGSASEFGFSVLEVEESEEGELSLFLECNQTTDAAAIRALTEKCLQIEIMFEVEYDGWGCVAQTGNIH